MEVDEKIIHEYFHAPKVSLIEAITSRPKRRLSVEGEVTKV